MRIPWTIKLPSCLEFCSWAMIETINILGQGYIGFKCTEKCREIGPGALPKKARFEVDPR